MKKLLSLLSVLGLLFACTPEENNPGGNDVNGNKVAATAISLNKAEVTLERGATVDLTVNATPVNADDLKIEWSSSNPSVASVDNGKITAIAAGTAEITAKCGELTAKCAVTVIVSATSIKLNKASIELEQGQSETLTATLEPADATDEIVWQSSDKFIAVVESGVVAAVGLGNATITASAGTLSTTCEVVVKALFIPEAIDLGLSVKWAKCNLGAEKPEGYGDYYAWGETEPYYSSQNPLTWKDGKSAGYIWASYRWCNGAYDKLTRYCPEGKANYWDGTDTPDNKTEFADYNYADDAARARLGGKWRMPTDAEWTELRTKCTWAWTTQNGVIGRLVTAPNGNSIFLPAAGNRNFANLVSAGFGGYYWSSSLSAGNPDGAWCVGFYSGDVVRSSGGRYGGFSVRPVTE